jgi:capsular polysaccharide biosynthesis protein
MSLSRKFVIVLIISVCSIAIVNIVAFYVFYNSYIKLYLSDKIDSRQSVTIEYINNIIEQQTLEDIDDIFSDVELEFFELLDLSE